MRETTTIIYSGLGALLLSVAIAWAEDVWLCPKPGFGFLKTDRPTIGCFPAEHRPESPSEKVPPKQSPSDPASRERLDATCRDYWTWVELNHRSGGGISFSSPQERVRHLELQQRFGFSPEVPAACR